MMATSDYLGENCENAGITITHLDNASMLPVLSCGMITKGIVFELNKYRSSNLCSWNDFYGWLTKLYGCTPP